MRARRGPWADLRRTLRESVRNDGEVLRLGRLKRRARPRKILLLIDVSGSMKGRTDDNMKLAHALMHAAPNVEVFTFGTRLTRVTRALRLKRREQALAAAAHLVSDWDGGTRIGDALQAFLAVPRFGSYARGAAVVIVSDGLERGDPSAPARCRRKIVAARLAPELADAARRRSRLSAADRSADRDPAVSWMIWSTADLPPRSFRMFSRLDKGRPRDRTRRCPSSYLASGRPALAERPDAAAHLRPLRADPARLSDPGISR
jgi:uncharacterized protein with von Willebrand factor type A (vWA) domain